jgi:hypothetical protein
MPEDNKKKTIELLQTLIDAIKRAQYVKYAHVDISHDKAPEVYSPDPYAPLSLVVAPLERRIEIDIVLVGVGE